MTSLDAAQAASVGSLGHAAVVDGELVVSWNNGMVETFQTQEREFSEGEPEPWFTFVLWADDKVVRHLEVRAPSIEAATSTVEAAMFLHGADRVTYIPRGLPSEDRLGRTRFIRTVGGYAPLAA